MILHFTVVPGEEGNIRFNYIVDKIDKETASVEIITTSFSHVRKEYRHLNEEEKTGIDYKLTMLDEPGYKKNVSLMRFYSHYMMGRNLKEYLKNRKKPDLIYCAIPSLDVAKVAADYAEANKIPFVIDVQDLWPEAFKMVFNIPLISDLVLSPMKRKADYIYSRADEIIAVSQTYADRALESNKKCASASSVYLGTDLDYFDRLASEGRIKDKPEDEIWISYIGTLGTSYDLTSVMDALKLIKDESNHTLKFIVMGDGPLKSKFEDYSKELGLYTDFTGRLTYPDMVGLLSSCDIAVNPIKKGSAGSIINKVGDYAAAGLPVINTQESLEYRNLIDDYLAGINCINGDHVDMAAKLLILIEDKTLREKMGRNSRRLAEERFNRNKTYKNIIDVIYSQ